MGTDDRAQDQRRCSGMTHGVRARANVLYGRAGPQTANVRAAGGPWYQSCVLLFGVREGSRAWATDPREQEAGAVARSLRGFRSNEWTEAVVSARMTTEVNVRGRG
jgi:hypothetical protein